MLELLETLRGYHDNHIPINIKTLINALMEVDEPRINKDSFYIQRAIVSPYENQHLYCIGLNTGINSDYANLWIYFTEDSGSNVYIHQFYCYVNDAPEYNINRLDERDMVDFDDADTTIINSEKTREVDFTKEIGELLNYNMYSRDIVFKRKDDK